MQLQIIRRTADFYLMFYHRISSEDATCGGVIAQALQSTHNNLQINANAASAIANLATSERDQVNTLWGTDKP